MRGTAPATSEAAPSGVVRRAWWRVRLYPLIFPIAVVTLIWGSAELHPATLIRPLVVVAIVGIGVALVATWTLRDRDAGSLVTAGVMCALISTGPVLPVMLTGLSLFLWTMLLRFRDRPWRFGSLAARVVSSAAVIVALTTGIKLLSDGSLEHAVGDVIGDLDWRTAATPPTAGSPDVLVLLLDAYPGDRAAAIAGADSEPFASALLGRGFQVQRDSHSNYMFTGLTLASMLNMSHLADMPRLSGPWDSGARDARRLREAINGASAFAEFTSRGYEVVSVSSGFDHAEVRRVDRFVSMPQPAELEIALLQVFVVGDWIDMAFPDLLASLQRARILDTLRAAEDTATEAHDRPRVILAHVPAPHSPWVFGRNGEPRTVRLPRFFSDDPADRRSGREEAFRAANDQAAYVGGLALGAVDRILETTETPPVIVLMSDHGSGIGVDVADAAHTDLAERSSNLMAIRDPERPGILARTLTPVNLFARILNMHFGAGLPEAPNDIYAWRAALLDTVRVDPRALNR